MKQIPFTNKTAAQLVDTYGMQIGVQAIYQPISDVIVPVIGLYKSSSQSAVYVTANPSGSGSIATFAGPLSGVVFVY